MDTPGLITVASDFPPDETMARVESEIKAKGMTLFARIDHAAGATAAGLALRPTTVFIFGNARGGTPLMVSVQTIGIDLPLKMLVWQDNADRVWLSYNDPEWLARRHGAGAEVAPSIAAMAAMLDMLAKKVVNQP